MPTSFQKALSGSLMSMAFGAMVMATPALAGDTVKYMISGGATPAIEKSLTGKAGDAAAGRKTSINRKKGNCLACHAISDIKEQPYHGNIGPSLDGVADRYAPGQLRMMLVDQKKYFPETIMPAFYKATGFRVAKKFKGKTLLSAQEVENVLAYLLTLK